MNIRTELEKRSELYRSVSLGDDPFEISLTNACELVVGTIKSRNKILIFGNGGSAAQAQHFAAELVCQFEKKRIAIPAISLTTDTSVLTAQSNDFGFDTIFARQIEAHGLVGDLAVGITTSDINGDHSKNILLGFRQARMSGLNTIGLFSVKTKVLFNEVQVPILVFHENTALIQEMHMSIIHILCKAAEE